MIFTFAFKNLFRNIRRTVAIVLTVAMGAGALFSFQGFIKGVLNDYKESTIHSSSGNGQITIKGYREKTWEEPHKEWIGEYEDLADFIYEQPGVTYIFPRVPIGGMLMHKKKSIPGSGIGIIGEEEAKFFNKLSIIEGSQLTHQENGILLGKSLAESLYAKVGESVKLYTKDIHGSIRKETFQVTGIFQTGSAEFDKRIFYIQLPAAQKLLRTDSVETIAVGLKDHSYWKPLAKTIEDTFPALEADSFAELNKIHYQHAVDWLKAQFRIVEIIILTIVLLGIFNTVSTSILERRQELGNLRANGESCWDIIRVILLEGFFLGLGGSILGIVLAYSLAKGLLHHKVLLPPGPGFTKRTFLSFSFTEGMAFQTIFFNLLSALLASLLAGLKVIKMTIAKSLRS